MEFVEFVRGNDTTDFANTRVTVSPDEATENTLIAKACKVFSSSYTFINKVSGTKLIMFAPGLHDEVSTPAAGVFVSRYPLFIMKQT
jgi:hypothetical protein